MVLWADLEVGDLDLAFNVVLLDRRNSMVLVNESRRR